MGSPFLFLSAPRTDNALFVSEVFLLKRWRDVQCIAADIFRSEDQTDRQSFDKALFSEEENKMSVKTPHRATLGWTGCGNGGLSATATAVSPNDMVARKVSTLSLLARIATAMIICMDRENYLV